MAAATTNEHPAELPPLPKPPKRSRATSAFNNFCKAQKKREGETVSDQFKRYGTQWKSITSDQKAAFKTSQAASNVDRTKLWTEHFEYLCSELDYCNKVKNTPAFLVYQNPDTKEVEVFSTTEGTTFINQHSYIVSRFDCHLAKTENNDSNPDPENAGKAVRNLFNTLYSSAIGRAGCNMPYSKVMKYGIVIEGLDNLKDSKGNTTVLEFKNPAKYGQKQQRLILQNAESLRCCISSRPVQSSSTSMLDQAPSTPPTSPPTTSPPTTSPPTTSPPTTSPPTTSPPTTSPPTTSPPTTSPLTTSPPTSSPPTSSPPTSTAPSRTSIALPRTSGTSPPTSSAATTTSTFIQTTSTYTKMVTIHHPSKRGTVRAPVETTHVVLDPTRRSITGACVIRKDLKAPNQLHSTHVVVKMIATYSSIFKEGCLYTVPEKKLFLVSSNIMRDN